jgi:ATP-dependent DNA helicase RecG
LLVTQEEVSEASAQRLESMTKSTDGFELAETDLKLRGPGQFFGTRQHGLPEFKLADLTQEMELLGQARDDAMGLLAGDPKLARPEHAALRKALRAQLGNDVELAQIG